ncbi:trypsin-like serine peptidase [Qipengyuania psychrotolerans]
MHLVPMPDVQKSTRARRRFFHGVLGSAAFILLSGASPPTPTVGDSFRLSDAIGTIICRGRGGPFLTNASLVERRDLVLAVSHFNFNRKSGRELPADGCTFTMRDDEGAIIFRSKFSVIDRGGRGPELSDSMALDWALLRLERPATGTPLQLGTMASLHEEKVDLVSYRPAMRGNRILRTSHDCGPRRQRAGSIILLHSCPTRPGLSGAPLLTQWPGGYRIVGIHAKRSKGFGIAVGLEGSVRKAISMNALQAKVSLGLPPRFGSQ